MASKKDSSNHINPNNSNQNQNHGSCSGSGSFQNIGNIEQILGYNFKNTERIEIAITHPGTHQAVSSKKFEKLEFLGDRVLGLSLSDFLYRRFPNESEGELAVRIATLAGTDFLIELAKKTKLIECFKVPKDFYISSHKNSSSIADMVEAVFGAVFLDSDFKTAQNVVLGLYKDDVEKIIYKQKDAKTRLQEAVQACSPELPTYRLVKTVGEVHNPIFEMEVSACGKSAIGQGSSKRTAEHDAAEHLLKILDNPHKKEEKEKGTRKEQVK